MIRITAVGMLVFTLMASVRDDSGQQVSQVQTFSSTNTLFHQIEAMDTILFDAIFNKCDLPALKTLLTEDFEFFHDKGGLTATNATQFVDEITKTCNDQQSGKEPRSRRDLVAGSMEVYPLNKYGAIETGTHRFFILREGQPEKAGDIAKFTMVWKSESGKWKLARALSYDHKPAK